MQSGIFPTFLQLPGSAQFQQREIISLLAGSPSTCTGGATQFNCAVIAAKCLAHAGNGVSVAVSVEPGTWTADIPVVQNSAHRVSFLGYGKSVTTVQASGSSNLPLFDYGCSATGGDITGTIVRGMTINANSFSNPLYIVDSQFSHFDDLIIEGGTGQWDRSSEVQLGTSTCPASTYTLTGTITNMPELPLPAHCRHWNPGHRSSTDRFQSPDQHNYQSCQWHDAQLHHHFEPKLHRLNWDTAAGSPGSNDHLSFFDDYINGQGKTSYATFPTVTLTGGVPSVTPSTGGAYDFTPTLYLVGATCSGTDTITPTTSGSTPNIAITAVTFGAGWTGCVAAVTEVHTLRHSICPPDSARLG